MRESRGAVPDRNPGDDVNLRNPPRAARPAAHLGSTLPFLRRALAVLVLALFTQPLLAGEPQGDEPPLLAVARLREAGDIEAALTKAQALVREASAPVEAHVA